MIRIEMNCPYCHYDKVERHVGGPRYLCNTCKRFFWPNMDKLGNIEKANDEKAEKIFKDLMDGLSNE